MTWGELRELTARIQAGLRALGVGPRRPRRGLRAEHPRGDRGVPRGRRPRRGLVELLAGLRRALGRRSLRADRAEGPAGRRRLPLRRPRPRPPRGRRADPRAGRRDARAARLPRRRRLAATASSDRRAPTLELRRGAVRPPAVGPVLQRHDRPAEGDRPRPRRHPARAAEEAAPAPRRPRRRPRLLVHDDRLDDVELPRRRAADAGVDRALRRQPGDAVARSPVGPRRRGRRDVLRHERRVHRRLHEGRRAPGAGPRPRRAAQRRRDRLAAVAGGLSLDLRRARAATRGCSRRAAAPTSARRSSAACRSSRSTRASCRAARWAATCRRSTTKASALVGEVGELVITQPMPSMPLCFWNDPGGERLREAYFDMYPGVWRHGDWIEITARGTAIIYGRSDSTINRGGVRMGTSEIYRAVLALDEIVDALVVDVPRPGAESWMALFVVLREGAALDDELTRAIARRVREDCSPRHVPDDVLRDRRGAAHAVGQDPRGAGQADPRRHPARAGSQPRLARQPGRAGRVRRARARAGRRVSASRAKKKQRRRAREALAPPAVAAASQPAERAAEPQPRGGSPRGRPAGGGAPRRRASTSATACRGRTRSGRRSR